MYPRTRGSASRASDCSCPGLAAAPAGALVTPRLEKRSRRASTRLKHRQFVLCWAAEGPAPVARVRERRREGRTGRTAGTDSPPLSFPDDPLSAAQVAVNHRGVGDDGQLSGFQDTDCYAAVTGALAGAFAGESAWPQAMLAAVIDSNRAVYGVDLASSLNRFCG